MVKSTCCYKKRPVALWAVLPAGPLTLTCHCHPCAAFLASARPLCSGITRLFPQVTGARLLYEDDKGGLYLFNPVNDHVVPIPNFSGRADVAMWDTSDTNVLVIGDGSMLHTFLYMSVRWAAVCFQASSPVSEPQFPPWRGIILV